MEIEERTGVRWNWTKYPATKEEAQKMVLPLSCLFTPLKPLADMPLLQYEPTLCKGCKAILNPHCPVDQSGKLWVCPFCLARNPFIHPELTVPQLAELHLGNTTVEYQLVRPLCPPPAFIYVVDTSLPADELDSLKDSLIQSFAFLPRNASIGLVTFGAMVSIWELSYQDIHKSYTFSGSEDYPLQRVREYLAVQPRALGGSQQRAGASVEDRFVVPLSEYEFALSSIIEELAPDPWPVENGLRPQRAVGPAIQLALSLFELADRKGCARVCLFVGGAVTKGPGTIVSRDLNENIRTHNEIKMDQAPHFTNACAFYRSLAERFVAIGCACDIFAGCLDQVGVMEMYPCISDTGGFLLFVDSFKNTVFKTSFQRFFGSSGSSNGGPTATDGTYGSGNSSSAINVMAYNATLEIQSSRGLKVAGCVGPVSNLNKPSFSVSETDEVGLGRTCAWLTSVLNHRTTLAFYFDACGTGQEGPDRFVQFITAYQHVTGTHRLRVTTVKHSITPTADPSLHISSSGAGSGGGNNGGQNPAFDQDAAAVLVARHACHKMQTSGNNVAEVMRWLDRLVIRLVRRFGTYTPGDPNSLRLAADFSFFPVFVYHLRRSEFLQVFNSSPDETTFFRSVLVREPCATAITMIQPTLHSYTFQSPPTAVLLDSASVKPDCILLLDSFFDVVIHYGQTIASWVQAQYHLQPEHEYFRLLLQAPKADAERLMSDRFPAPRFTECNHHGSQARILYNRINPSLTYHMQGYGQSSSEIMFTDDASLQTFMQHLKRLAVGND
eukprot:TRINITY_DN2548_c0_g1_i3.p1 TRINITY_DN2548_c0_g1~~TRINITY_DN2548_c0_g1_i3.p1  ORF type:complete len:781 (+),score=124.06 TRINITY_DN2548_c0_g1_i3:78-2420(+)